MAVKCSNTSNRRVRALSEILRFDGADVHDPHIDVWLTKHTDELHSIAQRWFERMRQCGTDVRELMHDGCPTACVEDAPFAYVNVFKAHVNVGFFHGATLPDPAGLLEGTGKYMRHVKLSPRSEINPKALNALIAVAYRDIKVRLKRS